MVEIVVSISGAAGTPAASGQDASIVDSVIDNGTGSWTINLKTPSLQNLIVKSIASLTADAIPANTAVTTSSVTITALNGAGAAKDMNFNLTLNFCSVTPYYF